MPYVCTGKRVWRQMLHNALRRWFQLIPAVMLLYIVIVIQYTQSVITNRQNTKDRVNTAIESQILSVPQRGIMRDIDPLDSPGATVTVPVRTQIKILEDQANTAIESQMLSVPQRGIMRDIDPLDGPGATVTVPVRTQIKILEDQANTAIESQMLSVPQRGIMRDIDPLDGPGATVTLPLKFAVVNTADLAYKHKFAFCTPTPPLFSQVEDLNLTLFTPPTYTLYVCLNVCV
jgi:hypothetical protein